MAISWGEGGWKKDKSFARAREREYLDLWGERERCPVHGDNRIVLEKVWTGKNWYEVFCGVCHRLKEEGR